MTDKLFGTLQTPLKPIHYTGIDSDTIDILIDPKERTITASISSEVQNTIEQNVANLTAAREKLITLSTELDEVEKEIAELVRTIQAEAILRSDADCDLQSRLTSIEDDYVKTTNYNLDAYVTNKIEDKIIEIQEGTLELDTYAKVADVATQFEQVITETDAKLADKVSKTVFDEYQSDMNTRVTDVEKIAQDGLNLATTTNTNLGILEATLGPLPTDKTLKEEIADTFATKAEVETTSYKIQQLDSELTDINKTLETVATKEYVAEEISKIDFSDTSLDNYYTKEEIDNMVIGGDINLDNYYTKSEVENKISSEFANIQFITAPSLDDLI